MRCTHDGGGGPSVALSIFSAKNNKHTGREPLFGLALFADPSPAFILLSLRLQEVLDKVIDGERDGRRDRVLDEVEAQALEQADNTLRPPDVHQCFYHIKLAELAQR